MSGVEKEPFVSIMVLMKCPFECLRSLFVPAKALKVLIIDDSVVDRTIAVKALDQHYHVVSAESGAQGIEKAYAEAPDLIVLDYVMQDMSGPQVCCVLKNDSRTKDIPVIFLTGMDTPESFVNGLEQGAEAYLTKPLKVRDLKEEVRLRIKQRSQ